MKYHQLSEKRHATVRKVPQIDVDRKDNIVYHGTQDIVPDSVLYNFFEFSNV